MDDPARWVIDTSTYTHMCRAGHAVLLSELAPRGSVIVPNEVHDEIERGRALYSGIPAVAAVGWAEVTVLTEEEAWTQLQVKAALGGLDDQHLGECAVIACAQHRGYVAILDERAAVRQAEERGVVTHDTLWIVIEAYKALFDSDRDRAAHVIDDLRATGMYLPIKDGESLMTWAYEEGLLP